MENRQNAVSPPSIYLQSPTTFFQADKTSFRGLVQKLTGSASNSREKLPAGDPTGPRRSPFKLKERRHHTMRKLEIKLGFNFNSVHNSSLIPSPVTPLPEFLFFPSPGTESPSSSAVSEEKKSIAEKGFHLHPSPLTTPRSSQPPELLTLFPLSSPSREKPVG